MPGKIIGEAALSGAGGGLRPRATAAYLRTEFSRRLAGNGRFVLPDDGLVRRRGSAWTRWPAKPRSWRRTAVPGRPAPARADGPARHVAAAQSAQRSSGRKPRTVGMSHRSDPDRSVIAHEGRPSPAGQPPR